MNKKHARGPWTADFNCTTLILDADGDEVAYVDDSNDARLIAAAPELLEALKSSVRIIRDLYRWEPIGAAKTPEGPITWNGYRAAMPEGLIEVDNAAGCPPGELAGLMAPIEAAIAKATGNTH